MFNDLGYLNRSRRSGLFVGLLLAGIIALAGCAKNQSTPSPTATPTPVAESAPTPTATADPVPTIVVPRNDVIDASVVGSVSQELILPRENYDVSRSVSELVKPHFSLPPPMGYWSNLKETRTWSWS